MKIIKGHPVIGGIVEGEALVTTDPISFMGGVNPKTGVISEKNHQLYGQSMKDKILVFPMGKGSTGGSYMLYDMCSRGLGPRGIINRKAEPVVAIGAIISKLPMMDRLEEDPMVSIKTGDWVQLDADQGLVKILQHSRGDNNA